MSLIFSCSAPPKNDPEIRIGFPSEPRTLDPLFATDLTTLKLHKAIYQGLWVRKKNDYERNGIVSDQSRPNSDGLIWEATLKEGFASPEDIKKTLERAMREPHPESLRYQKITKIAIPQSNQIAISWKGSESELKELLSLHQSLILKDGKPGEGPGVYRLENWEKNQSLILIRQNKIDPLRNLPSRISIQFLPQARTAFFLFEKGEIDAFQTPDFLASIGLQRKHKFIFKGGRSVQYLAINHKNECFDSNFRKALNYAIDRELIVSKILDSIAEPTLGPIPMSRISEIDNRFDSSQNKISQLGSKDFVYQNFDSLDYPNYNYQKNFAKELLAKSKCFPKILNQSIEFRMRSDEENQSKGAGIIQNLRDLGLKIEKVGLEKIPLYTENSQGRGDLTLLTWYSDSDSIFEFFDPLFHSKKQGNGGNRSFYSNIEVDSILDSRNPSKLSHALKIILEDSPWVFLWSIPEKIMINDKISTYPDLFDYL